MIDAHHHLWDLSQPFDYEWLSGETMTAINRSYLPIDLERNVEAAGIERSILVQTQHTLAENEWALQMAAESPVIAGVVGWVDLTDEHVEDSLLRYSSLPEFVGVRHVVQDEPDDDFIVREDVLRGLRALERHAVPFDLLFYHRHLKHAPTVARAVPDLPLVLDHLAKPPIRDGLIDNWRRELQEAAAAPNLHCKLSGLITEADWKTWRVDDLRPYVDVALECFGPERCMFGSDWPVCELAGEYSEVYSTMQDLVSSLSDDEQDQIFSRTAASFYGLSEPS